jgi:hypothetical protein
VLVQLLPWVDLEAQFQLWWTPLLKRWYQPYQIDYLLRTMAPTVCTPFLGKMKTINGFNTWSHLQEVGEQVLGGTEQALLDPLHMATLWKFPLSFKKLSILID